MFGVNPVTSVEPFLLFIRGSELKVGDEVSVFFFPREGMFQVRCRAEPF